jgi:hypothetical protein
MSRKREVWTHRDRKRRDRWRTKPRECSEYVYECCHVKTFYFWLWDFLCVKCYCYNFIIITDFKFSFQSARQIELNVKERICHLYSCKHHQSFGQYTVSLPNNYPNDLLLSLIIQHVKHSKTEQTPSIFHRRHASAFLPTTFLFTGVLKSWS